MADSGSLLDEIEMPAPVQAAVHLTGQATRTAARAGGFLSSLQQSGTRQGPGGDS